MQVIIPFRGDPETYVRNAAHLTVKRPPVCPNCRERVRMPALGYYSRWVSACDGGKVTRIKVRRFRCPACRLTTSILPDFAQPYRLVATDTVDEFLSGSRSGPGLISWLPLLGGYQRRFEARLPETRRVLSSAFGLVGLTGVAVEQWERMCQHFGGARLLTTRLAGEGNLTVFGAYLCHFPGRRDRLHTTPGFAGGRSPPSSRSGHRNSTK